MRGTLRLPLRVAPAAQTLPAPDLSGRHSKISSIVTPNAWASSNASSREGEYRPDSNAMRVSTGHAASLREVVLRHPCALLPRFAHAVDDLRDPHTRSLRYNHTSAA